jgi:hypothetical protein
MTIRLLCTLPNASEEISGVKFEPHERGVAGDVPEELAEAMLTIEGYERLDEESEPKRRGRKPKAADEPQAQDDPEAAQEPVQES